MTARASAGTHDTGGAMDLRQWVEPMTAAENRAVAAELVACTLGARVRPELRTDLVGRISHQISHAVDAMTFALSSLLLRVQSPTR